MSRSNKTDGDEIINLNEIHDDELSKPLTFIDENAIPSVHRARADSLHEANYGHNIQVTSRLDIEDDQINGKSPIGFTNRDDFQPENRDPFLPQSQVITQITPDVNIYQHKKTLAQGMMDLALLSANANQMRYVLQTDGQHRYFYPSLIMIGMSLFLQIAVGIGLIWNSRYNVKEHDEMCKANKANNWTIIGIFLVTILNVFISSFGVVDQTPITTAT